MIATQYKQLSEQGWMRVPMAGTSLAANGASSALTTTINFSTGAGLINMIPGANVAGNIITLPAGQYFVVVENDITTNQRYAVATQFFANGGLYSTRSPGNYARVQESHNEAGDSVSDIVDIPDSGGGNGTFNLRYQQTSGGAGGTNSLTGNSRVLIFKLQ